jgi:nucleoside-diphosphate-sugar epimerase
MPVNPAVYAFFPSAAAGSAMEVAYRAAHVDGPRNLLAALGELPTVRRLVFVSSTGVYGQTGGEWVNEDSPAEPRRACGKRLLEGEDPVQNGSVP